MVCITVGYHAQLMVFKHNNSIGIKTFSTRGTHSYPMLTYPNKYLTMHQ